MKKQYNQYTTKTQITRPVFWANIHKLEVKVILHGGGASDANAAAFTLDTMHRAVSVVIQMIYLRGAVNNFVPTRSIM